MKKLKLLCWTILITMNATGQISFDTYLHNGVYTFDDVFKVTRYEIFDTYKSQFDLTSDDIMELIDEDYIKVDTTDTIRTGSIHARYQQKYKGYVVENRTMSLLSKCDVVLVATGRIAENLDIDVTSPISEEAALNAALVDIDPPLGFTWQDDDYINSLIEDTEDTLGNYDSTATSYPNGEMVIAKKYGDNIEDIPENYALCWKFGVSYLDTVTVDSVYIDSVWVYNVIDTFINVRVVYVHATDSSIWSNYSPGKGGFSTGNVWTWYNGQRFDIETEKACGLCNYKLVDSRGIKTYYFKNPTKNVNRKLGVSSNNSWVGDPISEKEPATAHWAAERAYDYFKYVQYGTIQKEIVLYTNGPNGFGPVYYDPGGLDHYKVLTNTNNHAIIIPGGTDNISWSTLEGVAHEITHALDYERGNIGSGLAVGHEARAIEEGFCDIFALATETWVNGWCDWTFHDDGIWGIFQRSFHDPQNDYHPNGASSAPTFYATGYDTYFPYSHSGPLRKWFNHLSQGEWNWSPAYSGVGFNIASRISFLTFYYLLNNGTKYFTLADATLAVAAYHYGGKCSPVWKKVERAWYDVGVITELTSCWRYRIDDAVVIKQQVDPGSGMGHFLVRPNGGGFGEEEPDDDIISYSWSLPAHWTGTFSNDNDMFTLTDVDDDYSSQTYSVIVEYVPEGLVDTVYDTLHSVIHFSGYCTGEESEAKPGRPTNIKEKIASLSEVKVYPNPTDKQLVIEGANKGTTVQLFNLMGQEVIQSAITKGMEIINTSQLVPGVYILRLTDVHGNKETRRIVKQ